MELPDEVLMEVIGYLDLEYKLSVSTGRSTARPAHATLIQTCKRLQRMVTPLLYRDLYFERQDTEKTPASDVRIGLWFRRFFDRFGAFMRTISKKPEFVDYIRSVSYKFFAVDSGSLRVFLEYLARSKNLEHLNIFASPGTLFASLDGVFRDAKDYQPFRGLKSFSAMSESSSQLPASIFFNMVDLPSMQSIKCRIRMPDELEIHAFRLNSMPDADDLPPLQNLMITDSDFTPTLLDLVTSRRSIVNLFVPHLDSQAGRFLFGASAIDAQLACSPASLLPRLLPIRDSLQSLALSNHKIRWEEHDGSCLDLSSFPRLRVIKISDRLLLPYSRSNHAASNREDSIVHLLPPNLEELCICFDSVRGPFCSVQQLEAIAESPLGYDANHFWSNAALSRMSMLDSLAWILQILEVRQNNFPLLQSIKLLECYERHGAMKHWVLYDDVSGLYEDLLRDEHVDTCILIYGPPEPTAASRLARLPMAVRASLLAHSPV